MMPLHTGSQVFVSKTDLIKAFDPKPQIYTYKLAMLIFGQKISEKRPAQKGDLLQHLDQRKLNSLIS